MERDSRPRFKLVHVVMPRLWYVKLKQIRRSYRRKRPAGDGDARVSFSSSCSDTSFQSCDNSFHLHPEQYFRPIDRARSLIDVAFPLSPQLAASSAHLRIPLSPLRYAVSPPSAASPSSRFYPSPCRFNNLPPPATRSFPPKGIDISYPISPRKSPLPCPSPVTTFLSHRSVDLMLSASPPGRKPPPPTVLRRSTSDSRTVRSSLFACFSDDFKLPPAECRLSTQDHPACGASCTCTAGSSHDYCEACSTRRAAVSSTWRSSSARHPAGARGPGQRPSTHRRGLSLSCMSNARNSSPEALPRGAEVAFDATAPSEWERETSWSVLAELDNEVVRRRVVLRKRVGLDNSSHQLQTGEASYPSFKFLEAAGQRRLPPDIIGLSGDGTTMEADNCCSFRLSTSSGDVNAEHNAVPWDKDFSSATSEDPESLFTSFEVDSACVTPRRPPMLAASLTGFNTSKANASKVTEGRSEPSSWGASFIPEECDVSCSSPGTHSTDRSQESDTLADYDTEGSTASTYGTRQGSHALGESLADESAQSSDELEMRPLHRRTGLTTLKECEASALLSSSSLRASSSQSRKLVDSTLSARHTRGMPEQLPAQFSGCSSTGTCTDEDATDEESRLFPSSEDEIAVLNGIDSNEGRLVVSDESPERDEQYSWARTERKEGPYFRRKEAQCKRRDVAGKRVDRKSALSSVDSWTEPKSPRTTETQALVDLPLEIRGKVRESVPVVTRSYDPYRDFRDSMLEMILEKDILETQDLEELLHAYLALNEGEFHGLIVEVFTDLWYQIFEAETSRM